MSSAMAAVALRRERRKVNKPPRGHSTHYNSVLSLARSRSMNRAKRARTNSMSTLGSVAPAIVYKHTKYKTTLKVLMYFGTVFLIAGLVMIFVGVGSNVIKARNVGLMLIAFGTCLCLTKVFIQQKQQSDLLKQLPATSQSGDSLGSMGADATIQNNVGSIAATPDTDVSSPMLEQDVDVPFQDRVQQDGNTVSENGQDSEFTTVVITGSVQDVRVDPTTNTVTLNTRDVIVVEREERF